MGQHVDSKHGTASRENMASNLSRNTEHAPFLTVNCESYPCYLRINLVLYFMFSNEGPFGSDACLYKQEFFQVIVSYVAHWRDSTANDNEVMEFSQHYNTQKRNRSVQTGR